MGRRLRMTVELSNWLTELGDSEPATAAEVGAALVAVLDAAEPSGLAMLGSPTTPYSRDPRETADYLYQQMLKELQHLRRRVAELATPRKRAELRLHEQRDAEADPAEIAELEHERAEAQRREAPLSELSLRLQWDVEVFRAAKESGKAVYTVAEAQLGTAGAISALEGRGSSADATQLTAALKDAREQMERVNARGLETLHQIRDQVGQADDGRSNQPAGEPPEPTRPPAPRPPQPPEPPHPAAPRPLAPRPPQPPEPAQPRPPIGPPSPLPAESMPAPGLLELRADPLGSEMRILLAVEPAGTVTLLAVLEGPEAASDHGADAVKLASDLLTEIRQDGWPPDVGEVALEDSGAFLARFFPADDGSIPRRAAVLAES
jgi:hypothetical protein